MSQTPPIDPRVVFDRVHQVRGRISELASHRVELIAVTKSFGVDAINAAVEAGCDGIGENYAQELLEKTSAGFAEVPVHFIGHIQSNKVRHLVGHVDVWQTVDRISVVDEIGRRSTAGKPRVLIQVNTTGEPQKGGVEPADLDSLVHAARARGMAVEGLMTMGPTDGDRGRTEGAFRTLRSLADEAGLGVCSMGMSEDFEIALACGSTMVRIGSRLFGPRTRH